MTTLAARKRTRGNMSDSKSKYCIAPLIQVQRHGVQQGGRSATRGKVINGIRSLSVIVYCEERRRPAVYLLPSFTGKDKQWNVCISDAVSSVLLACREQRENGISSDERRDQSSSDTVLVRSNGRLDVIVG